MKAGPGRWAPMAFGALAAASGLIGCGDATTSGGAGDASSWVWLDRGEEVTREDARVLEAADFDAAVLPIGRLVSGPGERVELEPAGRAAPRFRVILSLAVESGWNPPGPEAIEEVLRFAARRRLEVEAEGALPAGLHLEWVGAGVANDAVARLLEGARRERIWGSVSLGVPRGVLDGDVAPWRAVARAADSVVGPIYGQRSGEADDPQAWDLRQAEKRRLALQALGRPYRTVLAVESAAHRGQGGEVWGRIGLAETARSGRLRLDTGFSLAGVDRRVYRFVASHPARIGDLEFARGEALLFRMPLDSALRSLRDQRAQRADPRWLGFVWRPWRAYPETAAARAPLGVRSDGRAGWERIFAPAPAGIESLRIAIEEAGARGRAGERRFRIRVENPTSLGSEIAFFDTNFVEVVVEGGAFTDVETGDFQRFEFLRAGASEVSVEALRRPQRLRIFAAALGPGEVLRSGTVSARLEGRGSTLRAIARFAVPGAGEFPSEVATWKPPR